MRGLGCRARVDNTKTHDRLAAVGFCRNLSYARQAPAASPVTTTTTATCRAFSNISGPSLTPQPQPVKSCSQKRSSIAQRERALTKSMQVFWPHLGLLKLMVLWLADGKARNIQHMMVTSFWPPDGHADVRAAIHGIAFRQSPGTWSSLRLFQTEGLIKFFWMAGDNWI
jgi:hypothetical protein